MKPSILVTAVLALAAAAPGLASAQAQDAAAPQAMLPGTWFAVDLATGAALRKAPGTGLDACRAPLDGPVGGDLSFRRRDEGWELARLGGPFRKAEVGIQPMGGRTLLKIGDQTIKIIKEAPDGSQRIHTFTGDIDDEVEVSFQKCPAR